MSTTKRFTWVNRETACRDLLQLAYHAPGFISREALHLLTFIRPSVSFLPELEAIVFDEERDPWERRFALFAIAEMPGDLYLPQFGYAPFGAYIDIDRQESVHLQLDFSDLAALCAHHPQNYKWLFIPAQAAGPRVYRAALNDASRGNNMNDHLFHRFIQLFDQHPHLLDLESGEKIYYDGGDIGRAWMNKHIEHILERCLVERPTLVQSISREWPELRELFRQADPALARWAALKPSSLREQPVAKQSYKEAPMWQHLYSVYQSAKTDKDERSFDELARNALHRLDNIPVRAAATYFVGLLQDEYLTATNILCRLVTSRTDNWKSGYDYWSPACEEALLALRWRPSPEVWEALVEGYFINRSDNLSRIFWHTIREMTDELEFGIVPQEPIPEQERRAPWFYALLDLPDTPT